jgi:hypothetical protein
VNNENLKYTPNEWRRGKNTLETGEKDEKYTRNEWGRCLVFIKFYGTGQIFRLKFRTGKS